MSVCRECGAALIQASTGRPRLYCSLLCSQRYRDRKPPRTIFCAWCEAKFETSKNGVPKYCSDRCRKDALNSRQRVARGGSYLPPAIRKVVCPDCSAEFETDNVQRVYCDTCQRPGKGRLRSVSQPYTDRAKHSHVCPYCQQGYKSELKNSSRCGSPACVSAQQQEIWADQIAEREGRKRQKAESAVVRRLVSAEVAALKRIASRKPKTKRDCEECGRSFLSRMDMAKYCSKTCRNRTYSRAHKARLKNAKRGEYVGTVAVFRRDRWHCQECGLHTPRELRGTIDPCAPELDHVHPLSQGGEHTWANVQLLCRSCNIAKSDSLPEAWHTSPYGNAPPPDLSAAQRAVYA